MSKDATLGQQTLQVSSASTLVVGSSIPKYASSCTNALVGGSIVTEKIMKTLTLLEQSYSNNPTTRKNYDSMNESSPHASCNMSMLNINLHENSCYSPTSSMTMQRMVISASCSEEQLAWFKN